MPRFHILSNVRKTVRQELKMVVEAESKDEATTKAKEALRHYPDPVYIEGVERIVTAKHNWDVEDIEIVRIREDTK